MLQDSDVDALDSCALRGHPFGLKTKAVTHRYAVVTILKYYSRLSHYP